MQQNKSNCTEKFHAAKASDEASRGVLVKTSS